MHQSSLHEKERAIQILVPTNTSRMSLPKAVKHPVAAVAQTVALEASNVTAPRGVNVPETNDIEHECNNFFESCLKFTHYFHLLMDTSICDKKWNRHVSI